MDHNNYGSMGEFGAPMPPYTAAGSMPPMDYNNYGSMGAGAPMPPYTAAGSMPPVTAFVEERTFSASSSVLVAASVSGLIALVALTAVYKSKNRRSTYTRLESVV